MNSIASLYRTNYPKYTHYGGDGAGRDYYIIKNNGGLCIEEDRPRLESTTYKNANLYSPPRTQYALSLPNSS